MEQHDGGNENQKNIKKAVEDRRVQAFKQEKEATGGNQASYKTDRSIKSLSFGELGEKHRQIELNELGEARLFKEIAGDNVLFGESGERYISNAIVEDAENVHYQLDRKNIGLGLWEKVAEALDKYAKRARKLLKEVDGDSPEASQLKIWEKNFKKAAKRLRTMSRRKSCEEMTRTSFPELVVNRDDLNKNPYLLGVQNGTYDLENKKFIPGGRKEDRITLSCPTSFQGIDVPCPLWDQTMIDIFGDPELIQYVQRIFGYALLGKLIEHAIIIFSGPNGRNGKSLIINVLAGVLGDHAQVLNPAMLLDQSRIQSSSAPRADLMSLDNLRLGLFSELPPGGKLDQSFIKNQTGDTMTRARGPHDKYEQIIKLCLLMIIMTNHVPHISEDDQALWERIHLIELKNSFVSHEPEKKHERRADPYLLDKLKEEYPGILAWMIRGFFDWQEQGLNPPDSVRKAVQNYRREEDPLTDFVESCCITGDQFQAGATELYNAFCSWWEANDSRRVPSQRSFGNSMTRRFQKKKTPNTVYYGVGLLSKDSL